MNRYVIKGRGEHRGKYLVYDRKPGSSAIAYKWVDEQRKAARWNAQAYPPGNYERRVLAEHNGYFVKMVAPKTIQARVPELQKFIRVHAAGAPERLDCYWFGADFNDASLDYCRDCAEKFVDEEFTKDPKSFDELYGECETAEERYDAAIDGGWSTEHDSPPYCEGCGAKLDGNLNESGADEEIETLTGDCPPAFDDPSSWHDLYVATMNIARDDPRWRAIAKVVDAARAAEQAHEARLADLAASPGMSEARSSLFSLLAARAEQKAPDPSFRLWDELLAWRRMTLDERAAASAREKPLIEEAKAFAKALGFEAMWMGGLFMIKAPYGTYYWPFVVLREQYRLWQPPAYQEGIAYAKHPCPSGDPDWPHERDGNPYAEKTIERSQWDCGYMNGLGH